MGKKCFIVLLLVARAAWGGVDPMELQARIFAMYVSRSAYCTSPVQIYLNDLATHGDVYGTPVLGSLDNSSGYYNGNYPCVIFKINERLIFRPNLTTGGCTQAERYETHICTSTYSSVSNLDGSTVSCTDAGDETVFVYLSTASANSDVGTGINPFSPPTATNANNGLHLSSALAIFGPKTGRFIIDGVGRITGANSTCTISLPRFAFATE